MQIVSKILEQSIGVERMHWEKDSGLLCFKTLDKHFKLVRLTDEQIDELIHLFNDEPYIVHN